MHDLVVVIQAGGKGRRLGRYTENCPKALVRVRNKTLLTHNLDVIHKHLDPSGIFIISDWKSEVITQYLTSYPHPSNPIVVRTCDKGTCAGLSQILLEIKGRSLMYSWCDLLLHPTDIESLKEQKPEDAIFLSNSFICRWSYLDSQLEESPSSSAGVAGLFLFRDAYASLKDIPSSGEFVRWLSKRSNYSPNPYFLKNTLELGDIKSYENYLLAVDKDRSRFFNDIRFQGETVIKSCIDSSYAQLIKNESAWYNYVTKKGYAFVPSLIQSGQNLILEKINGFHPDCLHPNKDILSSIIHSLSSLHSLNRIASCPNSLRKIYIDKTISRLEQVKDLLPLHIDYIFINGNKYINPWSPSNVASHIHVQAADLLLNGCHEFSVIHGDPTFSNILYADNTPYLIDPRGVFGDIPIHGDPDYDYAKLLYSVRGSYDKFNRHDFILKRLDQESFLLHVGISGYEAWEELIYEKATSRLRLDLIHALIWFSLSAYVKDSLDSILAAFLRGIHYYNIYYNSIQRLSPLPKSWFLDIDGTLVAHNSHLRLHQQDVKYLAGVHEFFKSISPDDTIVLTTSRQLAECRTIVDDITRISSCKNIKLLSNLGAGERIIINDCKPSGLKTAYAFNIKRDAGISALSFRVDPEL